MGFQWGDGGGNEGCECELFIESVNSSEGGTSSSPYLLLPQAHLIRIKHRLLLRIMLLLIQLPLTTVHLNAIRRGRHTTIVVWDIVILVLLLDNALLLLLALQLEVLDLGIDLYEAVIWRRCVLRDNRRGLCHR